MIISMLEQNHYFLLDVQMMSGICKGAIPSLLGHLAPIEKLVDSPCWSREIIVQFE